MRFISLFAGVGGFDLGFEKYHECVLQVEQDQHCLEVLRRRWPNVPKMEDVRDVNRESTPDVDMVVGGFPCQDVSLAGKRKGLDGGTRSGLWFEFLRIIRELRPRVAVIENVPGLFSSNGGRDFATILRGLAELRGVQAGERYTTAYRVLDAQFFGVPQRRRRIFFVASLGDGACAEILFERESVRRDTAKSRKTRPGAVGESQGRPGGGEPVIADPLRSGGDGGRPSPRTPGDPMYTIQAGHHHAVSTTVTAKWAKQAGGPAGSASETDNCVIQDTAEPLAATLTHHNYADRGNSSDCSKLITQPQIAPTLSTKNEVASSSTQREKWQEQSAELFGAVRRLTPVECCRLQGFPDDWNDDQTDSQRYRQMGNAVCVPVAEWIGRRIAEAIK